MGDQDKRRGIPRSFLLWLVAFYGVWLALVVFNNRWAALLDNWEMAAAMAAGSYFAGSTPMGGGTVGFPVLVLLFDQPATLGRDFSLCIQSIGMVSASIYIVAMKTPIAWRLLFITMGVSAVVTPITMLLLAPYVHSYFATLTFAILWCSFGVLHLARLRTILDAHPVPVPGRRVLLEGIGVGLLGGLSVGITGVGIDMMIYCVLISVARLDIRVAIPTSVILMAFNSVVGASTLLITGMLREATIDAWFAAAPVVALGAPLGALVVEKLSRVVTLMVVSMLCLVQFVWALVDQRAHARDVIVALLIVGVIYWCSARVLDRSERKRLAWIAHSRSLQTAAPL